MAEKNGIVWGDGFADIPLVRGFLVNGTKVKAVRMREPTVADQLAHDAYEGGPAAKEIAVMANLCDVAPQELHAMSMRDYKRLQAAYTGFTD